MRIRFLIGIAVTLCALLSGPRRTSACQCNGLFVDKNAWETAKQHAKNANVIFEGTLSRLEMRWNVLGTKEGEWVSAFYDYDYRSNNQPHMLVTFRVLKAYKGTVSEE